MPIRLLLGILLTCMAAAAQDCRPGSADYDFSIRCACVKDPNGQVCDLYKRNKSMYDGNGVQMWTPPAGLGTETTNRSDSSPSRTVRATRQQAAPVSAKLLPADTPFWRILPPGTRMAVGMRPQWMANSKFLAQLMRMAGPVGGQNVDAMRRELAAVDTVIMATTRMGGAPLILARAEDVVRATKAERDPYVYVDPDTILVGDGRETDAAMNRLFSQGEPSAEAKMAERVAPWSDFWLVMNLTTAPGDLAARLPGATRLTAGMAVRDGITVECWFDTASPQAARRLADRLRNNPKGTPIVDQIDGAQAAIEERGSSVRLYARLPGAKELAASAASRAPALAPVSRAKVSEVHEGMSRAEVEALLGKAHSETTIDGGDSAIATLMYNLDDNGTAQVRTVDGKVEWVRFQ
jgi:hypothetical protein